VAGQDVHGGATGQEPHAAGALVAREAGARVTGMRGTAPSRDFILAAEPSVAAALEALLDELGEFEPLPA